MLKKLYITALVGCMSLMAHAGWRTHFAYTEVNQIELAGNYVYGVSGSSLFRVHRNTEQIDKIDTQYGLHGYSISALGYDPISGKILIAYANGEADLLVANHVEYLPDLHNKDITASKKANNITFHNGRAYLSMPFGIVTFSMFDHTFVDTYFIGDEGARVDVKDVVIQNDTIYALSTDVTYKAALNAYNLLDYRYWTADYSGRVHSDPNKGKRYVDAEGQVWTAGGAQGIVCRDISGNEHQYKPDGPLYNTAYHVTVGQSGRVYMVQGGRWAAQYNLSGDLMIYENDRWSYIPQSTVIENTGAPRARDFMKVVEDPRDPTHYFVSSYGGGVFEYKNDIPITQWHAENSTLSTAIEGKPYTYSRCDGLVYDEENNLWVVNAFDPVSYLLCAYKADSTWAGRNIYIDGKARNYDPPTRMLIDNRNPNWKWICGARQDMTLLLSDDNGTKFDESDDQSIGRMEWISQDGQPITPDEKVFDIWQDRRGSIWMGTGKGVIIIPDTVDYFQSNACRCLRITDGDAYLTENDRITCFAQDSNGYVWVGSEQNGIYVLNENADSLITRYNTGNTPMPGNNVLTMAYDANNDIMYVGTSLGLVSLQGTRESGKDPSGYNPEEDGVMYQFHLHPSYQIVEEVAVTGDRTYATASGALFSVDRNDKHIETYDKISGLSGSTVSHIGYDPKTRYTVVVYTSGHLDLLRGNTIVPMPDLFLRAEQLSVEVNSIHMDGKGRCYLSMTFGIIVLNLMKEEVEATYYIGKDASDVNVLSVITRSDSIIAVSSETSYTAIRGTNLLDNANWKMETASKDYVDYVVSCNRHDTIQATEGKWIASRQDGLVLLTPSGNREHFAPEGPINNMADHVQCHKGRLYVANGGYWANNNGTEAEVKMYENNTWSAITHRQIWDKVGFVQDGCVFAFDPNEDGHFYMASYSRGVVEFRNHQPYKRHSLDNSTLSSTVNSGSSKEYFVRTTSAMVDADSRLWVVNAGDVPYPVHTYKDGQWHGLSFGGYRFSTPIKQMIIDNRNPNHKWFAEGRESGIIYLLDDNGTPDDDRDDVVYKQSSLTDQKGTSVPYGFIYSMVQGPDGIIWVGTNAGPIMIESAAAFQKGRCTRVLNRRNDGTDLADYLLSTEVIRAIAIDGGNRKWFGTENNGIFLINEDGDEQLDHFTNKNSNLPSNQINSLAFNGKTGELFIATAQGICSYQSDASDPQEDYSSAYAYPNPVRPEFEGFVTITGLMNDSWVQILDQGGNMVFKTRSNGGTATWDLSNGRGGRVSTGVYSALCTPSEGRGTGVVKILVMGR